MTVLRTDVVALYVDKRGPYPGLVAEWYDEERNAEMYAGPHPVVAHPPCGPWGRLKHLSKYDAPEHALHAVDVVREFGGVLEHPKGSALWKTVGLPLLGAEPDVYGGRTIEVNQVDFGHVARKATWVYMVRTPEPGPMPPPREPTHWCSGFRTGGGRKYPANYRSKGCAVPPGIKVCSAQQRRRTPPAFAAWLLDLASKSRPVLP
jgi:hypothetical protein